MSEQDKRAEEVWRAIQRRFLDKTPGSPQEIIAVALAQARREGYLDGIHAARDACERGHGSLLAKEESRG